MHRVAARLRNHYNLPARALAVFRRISIGKNIEFPNRIDPQQLLAGTTRRHCQLTGTHVFHAVH